jgi:hypothetical protein
VELIERKTGEKADVPKDDVVAVIQKLYETNLSFHRVITGIDEI